MARAHRIPRTPQETIFVASVLRRPVQTSEPPATRKARIPLSICCRTSIPDPTQPKQRRYTWGCERNGKIPSLQGGQSGTRAPAFPGPPMRTARTIQEAPTHLQPESLLLKREKQPTRERRRARAIRRSATEPKQPPCPELQPGRLLSRVAPAPAWPDHGISCALLSFTLCSRLHWRPLRTNGTSASILELHTWPGDKGRPWLPSKSAFPWETNKPIFH